MHNSKTSRSECVKLKIREKRHSCESQAVSVGEKRRFVEYDFFVGGKKKFSEKDLGEKEVFF